MKNVPNCQMSCERKKCSCSEVHRAGFYRATSIGQRVRQNTHPLEAPYLFLQKWLPWSAEKGPVQTPRKGCVKTEICALLERRKGCKSLVACGVWCGQEPLFTRDCALYNNFVNTVVGTGLLRVLRVNSTGSASQRVERGWTDSPIRTSNSCTCIAVCELFHLLTVQLIV